MAFNLQLKLFNIFIKFLNQNNFYLINKQIKYKIIMSFYYFFNLKIKQFQNPFI